MNQQIKENLFKITIMWIIVLAAFTLPASCAKAVHAFYHQVIVKDQVVGRVN